MTTYQAKTENRLSFGITGEGQTIGQLFYKSWFRFDADITTAEKVYQIVPKGFWGTTIELREGEKILLKFKMNWSGEIVIQTYFNSAEKDYLFKHSGIFKETFTLKNRQGSDLLVMKPQFSWKRSIADYEIETTPDFEALDYKAVLLIVSVHCANYYLSMSMAGTT